MSDRNIIGKYICCSGLLHRRRVESCVRHCRQWIMDPEEADKTNRVSVENTLFPTVFNVMLKKSNPRNAGAVNRYTNRGAKNSSVLDLQTV